MPGVKIGHGVIIGANAVITKDILPSTIVAGVPAKPLRMRFSGPVIAHLLEMAWVELAA
ncbi:acetyltransferase-like isoleucine patch superfamily enzyme [Bartonella callosciuri]|uniref:Acetyltransferase-like isoleucine patch superfamily enzyme n=1 Tax=Bartonella callosciuri TaxID=686223 RepID=A0A840NV61_9HYPH|nr:acetyltransferase-like isoleucine patch superfamily enzyme [Bartonella callosciuri]